ncbi:PREDICTED: sodium/hydrogen exchanger 10 [Propithecus coquereli]|uniref:sodium/hydrogen exchanger 10 n=1 Tax=Propithecus coquereli TaxID=379532 RepID=UPI00063F53A9|nr:PREDICTED: sodium/hydrogen exchanger 10 [Propithecus coquereli]
MDADAKGSSNLTFRNKHPGSGVEWLWSFFLTTPGDLPEIIFILSLICIIGAFWNLHLKDFPVPLSVILFFIGCSFETLSFTSYQIQRYADAIQEMSPELFFRLFTPVIFFNVAFDMDVYILQKLLLQILLITVPGLLINYFLILWYLSSVNKLHLKDTPWLLFSAILVSSDPMLTATAIRDLGLSRSLSSLIIGESLMTSVTSLTTFSGIMDINKKRQSKMNHTLAHDVIGAIWSYFIASFFFGILSAKLIQLWMSNIFDRDVNHISFIFSMLYFIFYICKFWNCLSFVAFLMVFTFVGLFIPAHVYFYVTFSDIYYSISIYFTLIVFRLLVFLLMSPILSQVGHGFNWRWAFIMVWSEVKGTPNINMALLLAYSDPALGSEREKSQILFHGLSVCLISVIVNRFILPRAVTELGLRDVTSTKYKSVHYTFQHFQELTKSSASALKFDKDLANADWNMVEKAIILQNPYTLNQEETTEHQKVTCPDCNKEINETLNTEAMELANRRLLSAQIASYQRQYRNEILTQSAVQVLVGAAGSFGEKGECISIETLKKYSESKKFLTIIRKILLNSVYNTKNENGVPSGHFLFRVCHKIVFTAEFEYVGYLVILLNIFPIIIFWIPDLGQIYDQELRCANYIFLTFYILEGLLKMTAIRKDFFLHTWNLFELLITLIVIIDIILVEINAINKSVDLIQTLVFIKVVQLLRLLRILKLITPKLLQIIDKRMSHHLSFRYAILKGYVQGESDVLTIIDQIANSNQVKQMLLKRVTKNMEHAMKELGYLECDHPEIAITMKTKEEVNVMLNMAKEIIKAFRLKGIIHKVEGTEIEKFILTKKRQVLEFQSVIKPLTVEEVLYHVPWLDKEKDHIDFIQVIFLFSNIIFNLPTMVYVFFSFFVPEQLKQSKPGFGIDQILESEEKDQPTIYTDYALSGEIIGEINCLTNEPMKYSATCKTVVEVR